MKGYCLYCCDPLSLCSCEFKTDDKDLLIERLIRALTEARVIAKRETQAAMHYSQLKDRCDR